MNLDKHIDTLVSIRKLLSVLAQEARNSDSHYLASVYDTSVSSLLDSIHVAKQFNINSINSKGNPPKDNSPSQVNKRGI